MKKTVLTALTCAALAVLLMLTAYADVIYEPYGNDFYEKHRADMVRSEREYEMNGPDGEVIVCDVPNGKEIDRIPNGIIKYINYIYTPKNGSAWALVEYDKNAPGSFGNNSGWISTDMLILLYDAKSFAEDFGDEFIYDKIPTIAPAEGDIVGWKYPGSDAVAYEKVNGSDQEELKFDCWWKDKNGDQWGHISYLYGMRDFWVYLPDPFRTEPIDLDMPETAKTENVSRNSGNTGENAGKSDNKPVLVASAAGAAVVIAGVLIGVIFGKKKKS